MTPKKVKIFLFLSFVSGLIFGIWFAFYCDQECVIRFKKLTECLFSAFLTIASFLFAFETFIIFKVKEGVYDSSEYRIKYEKYIAEHGLYSNLKRFSDFLLRSTVYSFVTSLVLLVYIVTDSIYIFPVCLAFISLSVTSLILAWKLMRDNLNSYFSALEK